MTAPAKKSISIDDTVHYTIEDRERLGRLESDVTNLQAGFTDLRTEVRSGFDRIAASMNDQAKETKQGNRTNWNVVLTGLGTVITLVIAAGSVTVMYVNNTIRPQELAIDYIRMETERDRQTVSSMMNQVSDLVTDEIGKFDAISRERGHSVVFQLDAISERIENNEQKIESRQPILDELRDRTARLETRSEIIQKNP